MLARLVEMDACSGFEGRMVGSGRPSCHVLDHTPSFSSRGNCVSFEKGRKDPFR